MGEVIDVKVRRIGTSLGVILPNRVVREEELEEGRTIEIVILKKNHALIEKMFGIAKNAKIPFKRDREERI